MFIDVYLTKVNIPNGFKIGHDINQRVQVCISLVLFLHLASAIMVPPFNVFIFYIYVTVEQSLPVLYLFVVYGVTFCSRF